MAEPRKCSGEDCDNDAGTLQCPTCLKQDIFGSFFCSQECFKNNWVRGFRAPSNPDNVLTQQPPQATHKSIHKKVASKLPPTHDP